MLSQPRRIRISVRDQAYTVSIYCDCDSLLGNEVRKHGGVVPCSGGHVEVSSSTRRGRLVCGGLGAGLWLPQSSHNAAEDRNAPVLSSVCLHSHLQRPHSSANAVRVRLLGSQLRPQEKIAEPIGSVADFEKICRWKGLSGPLRTRQPLPLRNGCRLVQLRMQRTAYRLQ